MIDANSPVLPERSHYFDVGVDQKLLPGLTVGADAYLKIATDLLDDGQFGQAVVVLGLVRFLGGRSGNLAWHAPTNKNTLDGGPPVH